MTRMPIATPERKPANAKAQRRDGARCDLMATLGLPPRGEISPDDQVHDWSPVT
jgi:hypothetical protein